MYTVASLLRAPQTTRKMVSEIRRSSGRSLDECQSGGNKGGMGS